jgi:twitching motility protein PilT
VAQTRVLIVHDDPAFVDRIHSALAVAMPGVEALTAISGPRALGIAKQQRPDAIVIDGDLIGMDGYAFTVELKADPELAETPVLILASEPTEASALKARQAGAAAHLPSSTDTDTIVQKVAGMVSAAVGGAAAGGPLPGAVDPAGAGFGAMGALDAGLGAIGTPEPDLGLAPVGDPVSVVAEPQGTWENPATVAGPNPAARGNSGSPVGDIPESQPSAMSAFEVASASPDGYGAPQEPPAGYGAPQVVVSPSASTPAGIPGAPPPGSDVPHVDDLLRLLIDREGSDLHITVGSPPGLRLRGEIVAVEGAKSLTPRDTQEMLLSLMSEEQRRRFETELELDFAYSIPGLSRFRTNVFQQRNSMGAVFRVIPLKIPTLDELGLPRVCKFLAERPRGLVLVTGPTGSGKSTTLAAMIDHINSTRPVHIITMEDPIEFMHKNKRAYVNQREVGEDTHSFTAALKRVLRQDPDVILVGEMRDLETISAALTAAETGHLVLATLHTTGGPETVDRIIDVFPPHQQQQVRMQLSTTLEGVLSQTLLRSTDGRTRVMAMEIMLGIPAIGNLIREGKTHQMATIIQGGASMGMQTLDQHLKTLLQGGKITYEEAIQKAKEPRELAQMVGRKI